MRSSINKTSLSERDICSKYLTPSILEAGWDLHTQIREEYRLTKGRILVRGKLVTRGTAKRANGMQQAPNDAEMLDVPFAFSSNGDGFLFLLPDQSLVARAGPP